jgi:hypothetical protein
MNENEHKHHRIAKLEQNKVHNNGPYWKRAHHDWRFWVGLSLCLIAILYYVMSVDFSIRPQQTKQSSENNPTP